MSDSGEYVMSKIVLKTNKVRFCIIFKKENTYRKVAIEHWKIEDLRWPTNSAIISNKTVGYSRQLYSKKIPTWMFSKEFSDFFQKVFSWRPLWTATFSFSEFFYSVSLRIQSECGKIRTRETPNKLKAAIQRGLQEKTFCEKTISSQSYISLPLGNIRKCSNERK